MTQCIVTRHEWKDLKAWQDYGISLSTPSNEAAKMFDALITQLFGWYEDESLGGISGTIQRIRQADPDYVVGPLLESRLKLSCHTPETFPELQDSLNEMEDLVKKKTINEWEMKHVEAVRHYADGYPSKSLKIWDEMITSNPYDVLSLRMAYMMTIHLGDVPLRNSIMTRVIPLWKPHMAFYGNIQGMYAFALNESNCHEKAEKYALKALEVNPCDSWSTHARAHIMDSTDRAKEGVTFMEKTEDNWTTGTFLMEHNYWHWALFYIDEGNFESALSILDDHIMSPCSRGSFGALRDGASLLYRFNLEGVATGQRCKLMSSYWRRPSEHAAIFNDVHMMMSHLGAKDYDSANSLLESCNEFLSNGKGTNWQVTKEVGLSLCEAMMNFEQEQYDDVVELLSPVRDDVIKIGGSDAQRDVFNLLLIHAAIQSTKDKHRDLGTKLIRERKEMLGETGVTKRLEKQLLKRVERP